MTNKAKAGREAYPEPLPSAQPAEEAPPETPPIDETQPAEEAPPEIEPEGEPPPKEGTLGAVAIGENFFLGGQKYRLKEWHGEMAMVVLLKTLKNQVAPNKYVEHDIGVETLELPGDTVVD